MTELEKERAAEISAIIIKYCKDNRFSQKALSERSGIPYANIHRYYHALNIPQRKYMRKLRDTIPELDAYMKECEKLGNKKFRPQSNYTSITNILQQVSPYLKEEERGKLIGILSNKA